MKKLVLAAVLFSLAIVSCKKKDSTSPAAVLIRIKNNSTANLSYAAISNKNYGGINAGMVTDYKAFDRVIAYAGAQIVFSTDTIYAGYLYCGTPPLPMLENGKYRLEIASDSLAPNAFSATYVRE